jgi:hypothetical protein
VLTLSSCGKSDWFCSCTFTEESVFFIFENEEGEFYRRTRESDAEADCERFSENKKAEHPDAVCALEEV